jgi:putative transposase
MMKSHKEGSSESKEVHRRTDHRRAQRGEAGAKVADLCRKYGMSDASYYNWKTKYAGMTVSDLRRLRDLEATNRRLKQIVAEQALDNLTLKELLSKNF